MRKFQNAVQAGAGSRREVDSGTWPPYLYMHIALLASGIVQLVDWEVPASIANSAPAWYDVAYIFLQPVGAVCTLTALLFVDRPAPSLQLERLGCIITATIGLVYATAVTFNNGGVPQAGGTWLVIALSAYSLRRTHEINLAFGHDTLAPFRGVIRRLRERGPRAER